MILFKRDGVLNEADFQSQFKDKEGTNLLCFTVAQTDSGWSSVKTLHEYLVNTFDKWLEDNKIERPVIVFSDCHETRSNHILAKRLTELKIILITFVPNTTHMSQPVDVALFRRIKLGWGKHLHEFTRNNPGVQVNANNFSKIFYTFLTTFII